MTALQSRFSLGIAAAIAAALLIGTAPARAGSSDSGAPATGTATQVAVAEPPTKSGSSLPPSDALSPAPDLAALLKPGVPAEVTRAALRQAWTSDPAIRDFVGMTEDVVEPAR